MPLCMPLGLAELGFEASNRQQAVAAACPPPHAITSPAEPAKNDQSSSQSQSKATKRQSIKQSNQTEGTACASTRNPPPPKVALAYASSGSDHHVPLPCRQAGRQAGRVERGVEEGRGEGVGGQAWDTSCSPLPATLHSWPHQVQAAGGGEAVQLEAQAAVVPAGGGGGLEHAGQRADADLFLFLLTSPHLTVLLGRQRMLSLSFPFTKCFTSV